MRRPALLAIAPLALLCLTSHAGDVLRLCNFEA